MTSVLRATVAAALALLVTACGTNASTIRTPTPSSHRVPVSGGTASPAAIPVLLNRPDVVKALGCELAPWGREPVFAGNTPDEALHAVGQEYFLAPLPNASSFSTMPWEGDPLIEEAANPSGWYLLFAQPGGQGLGVAHVWKASDGTYMATPGPDCARTAGKSVTK